MKENGYFVISLDFELLWGVFDKIIHEEKEAYFNNTRKVIPEILDLFSEYNIHCTWATVGMLFNRNFNEWELNKPTDQPNYLNHNVSAYEYASLVKSELNAQSCFARDLILQIKNTPNQEIATHTYSHYYCLEEGQTIMSFRSDLEKSIELSNEMGIKLESLVFPRNQFNKEYLNICYELGIKNVRSNPDDWYWNNPKNDSLINKIFRTGDAYFGFNNKSYKLSDMDISNENPLSQKASRLLRPYSNYKILNKFKLNRIKSEMSYAAKNAEVYHLWWHPHNFGNNPKENILELKMLLEHYKKCQRKYGFTSLTMGELNSFR